MEQSVDRSGRPMARTEDLAVEQLDGETLVYDLRRHRAHCLNGASATVWRACDGTRTLTDLARVLAGAFPGSSEETAAYALQQLADRHLLEGPTPVQPSGSGRRTRREILRRAAIGGVAVGLGVPMVRSIVAPTPAQAFSCIPSGGSCTSSAQCCSGVCAGGTCL